MREQFPLSSSERPEARNIEKVPQELVDALYEKYDAGQEAGEELGGIVRLLLAEAGIHMTEADWHSGEIAGTGEFGALSFSIEADQFSSHTRILPVDVRVWNKWPPSGDRKEIKFKQIYYVQASEEAVRKRGEERKRKEDAHRKSKEAYAEKKREAMPKFAAYARRHVDTPLSAQEWNDGEHGLSDLVETRVPENGFWTITPAHNGKAFQVTFFRASDDERRTMAGEVVDVYEFFPEEP